MCESDADRAAVECSDGDYDDDKDDGLWSDTEFDVDFDEPPFPPPPPVSHGAVYQNLASRANPTSLRRTQ